MLDETTLSLISGAAVAPNPVVSTAGQENGRSLKSIAQEAIARAESSAIVDMLGRTHWNRTKAAKLLGISYRALLYKIKNYNLMQTFSGE